MTKLAILTMTGIMTVAALPGAQAGVDAREARQKARVQQGVNSGELTRREAAKLAAEQAAIRGEEYRYRHNDGHLGPWERLDLQRDMNKTSRDIFKQKHDGQER